MKLGLVISLLTIVGCTTGAEASDRIVKTDQSQIGPVQANPQETQTIVMQQLGEKDMQLSVAQATINAMQRQIDQLKATKNCK